MTDQPRPLALVLGASRGLGYLVAEELVRRGHDVVLAARDSDRLSEARTRLLAAFPDAGVHCRSCDVSDADAVTALVDDVEASVGPVEVAVVVAGIIQVGPWGATRHEHFQQCLDVMVWGPINVALALTPRMVERGSGRFGVVSSVGGRVSVPRLLPYSTAKFAAAGFAEGLAAELAGTGVTVTTILPGLMRTGSHEAATFFGDPARQYAWFASLASAPLLTVSGERAARQIVTAVLAGRPVARIGATARLAELAHGVAPNLVVAASGLASRVLPTGDDPQVTSGSEARRRLASPVVDRLTTLADRAARRSNEYPTGR